MKTVKARIPFQDLAEGVPRETGDVFSVSDGRAEELLSIGAVEMAEEKRPVKRQTKRKV